MEPTKQPPVDPADVLRRVGANVEMPVEETAAEAVPASPIAEPQSSTTEQPRQISSKGDEEEEEEEEEEESIDNYMSRLMQRLRSSSDNVGAAARPSRPEPRRPAAEAAPVAAPVAATAAAVVAPPATPAPRREPAQMSPRAEAPEKHVDFSALRELANLSAHVALNRHARKALVRSLYSKLLVAFVALTVAAALLWMWNSMECVTNTFYAALAALMVAVLFGIEYAVVSGRSIINKSGRLNWKLPKRAKPEASAATAADEPRTDDLPGGKAQANG